MRSRDEKVWIDYCIINMMGKTNKLFADNRFDETIIKKKQG